jgi:hypothetical protein
MIKTYHNRTEESSKRLQLRSASGTFTNIIADGTNCSQFEAEVITKKAKEVFQLGEYSEHNTYQTGQMKWRAICENEPPGKKLSECVYKPIILTVHNIEEDTETMKNHGRAAKRGQQINRMANEALDQGTLLTIEDLAYLLDCDEKTIRRDIKKYQITYNVLIPTRGNKKDIGPGVTHRERTIELFIQGKDPLTIARELKHSLKAVERYISAFSRVIYCQSEAHNTLKTALIVGVSVSLVNKYLELKEKYWGKEEYRDRLKEIYENGNKFWEYCDSKKKPGQTKRRKK